MTRMVILSRSCVLLCCNPLSFGFKSIVCRCYNVLIARLSPKERSSSVHIQEEWILLVGQVFETCLQSSLKGILCLQSHRCSLLVEPHDVDLKQNARNDHTSKRENAGADAKSCSQSIS